MSYIHHVPVRVYLHRFYMQTYRIYDNTEYSTCKPNICYSILSTNDDQYLPIDAKFKLSCLLRFLKEPRFEINASLFLHHCNGEKYDKEIIIMKDDTLKEYTENDSTVYKFIPAGILYIQLCSRKVQIGVQLYTLYNVMEHIRQHNDFVSSTY